MKSKKTEKKINHANSNQKKAAVAMYYQTQLIQNVSRDVGVYFIIIKGSKHQEVITIIEIFTPKHSAPKDMKQKN